MGVKRDPEGIVGGRTVVGMNAAMALSPTCQVVLEFEVSERLTIMCLAAEMNLLLAGTTDGYLVCSQCTATALMCMLESAFCE